MSVMTVKVSNVSLNASELELKEFFSFSGDILYLELKSENEESQTAYVTFKDSQGANTAVLLTGATITDKTVTISLDPEYQLPPSTLHDAQNQGGAQDALRKAEDVVTTMLARGFILGKDAVSHAKAFDERHKLTSTASVKIASLDQRYGLTEKINTGTTVVNNKMKEIDEKYQVSQKTKSAIAVAEEKVGIAGSAIMKNRYVFTGASWMTDTFQRVAKAATEVGDKTREKVDMAEEVQKRKIVGDSTDVHLSEFNLAMAVPLEVSTVPKEASPKAPSSPKAASPIALSLAQTVTPKASSPPKNASPKVSSPPKDAPPKATSPPLGSPPKDASPKASSLPKDASPKAASPPKDASPKAASPPKDAFSKAVSPSKDASPKATSSSETSTASEQPPPKPEAAGGLIL